MNDLKSLEAKLREAGKACWIKRNDAVKNKNWDRAWQLYGQAIGYEMSADMLRAQTQAVA